MPPSREQSSARNVLVFSALLTLFAAGCQRDTPASPPSPSSPTAATHDPPAGERPAAGAEDAPADPCATCHLEPPVDALPRAAWPSVLDDMMPLSGCTAEPADDESDACAAVRERYLVRSPESLQAWRTGPWPTTERVTYRPGAVVPTPTLAGAFVGWRDRTSIVAYRIPEASAGGEWLQFDRTSGQRRDGIPLPGVAVAEAPVQGGGRAVLWIGDPSPNDRLEGQLVLRAASGERTVLAEQLRRPVDMDVTRVADGEFLVAEYGHVGGRLSFWTQAGDEWTPTTLEEGAGAIRTRFDDLDADGDADVLALFAQSDERLIAFERTDSGWVSHLLLRFHPSWGSVTYRLVDLDGDGDQDLLVVNGDNNDLTGRPVRPYHGVRAYERTGPWTLEERWFHALPGAYDVEWIGSDDPTEASFIVAGAFLDASDPVGLVYLERTGPWRVAARTIPNAPRLPACRLAVPEDDRSVAAVLWCGSYLGEQPQEAIGFVEFASGTPTN